MSRLESALRDYRSRTFSRDGERPRPRPAAFILCSEDCSAASIVAACEPSLVLQMLGGVGARVDVSTRATLELGVAQGVVRHVVVCGHAGCRATGPTAKPGREGTMSQTLAQCRALLEDPVLGSLFRAQSVSIHAMWFDEPEGDVYLYDSHKRLFEWMDDGAFDALLGKLDEPREPHDRAA